MTQQNRQILFTGNEANNNGWLNLIFLKPKCFVLHMRSDKPIAFAVRKSIADILEVDVDRIGESLHIYPRGENLLMKMNDEKYIFSHYRVDYTLIQEEVTHREPLGATASSSDELVG